MEGVDIFSGVIFPYINLAIFLVLATLMLKGPFKKALSAKRDAYEDLVKKAKVAKDEAEKRNQDLKDRIQQLDKEVEEIRLKAKAQAEDEARQLVDNAEALALHLKKEARRIAEAEIVAAKHELQREIIEQVKLQTVEQLKQALDDSRQHQIVQQGVSSLGQIRSIKTESDADSAAQAGVPHNQKQLGQVRAEVNS